MDWFSWLSKTSLEPTLVYEYGQAFSHNELEEEDIAYFNHEFLQSMGISIAKHRLEIIKLARREKKGLKFSKLLLVLKKTKKSLTKYIAKLIHGDNDDGRALVVLPNKKNKKNKKKNKNKGGALSYSSRWRKTMMIRNNNNKKLVIVNNREKLRLTNGDYFGDICDDPMVVSSPRLDSSSNPLMYDLHYGKDEKVLDDQEDGNWTPALEEIKWDAMFKDLKPT